ncbi:hypothetical protein PMAYCL1PPCAC_20223, partial [Pristionchus mayeri]
LHVYCTGDECERWNRLKEMSSIMAPDSGSRYFAQLEELHNVIGFTKIGNELLRADVLVYNRPAQLIFIADSVITQQPFSFAISKKRRDLVESFNRAIAMTSAIYPRIMARYIAPYGVYSRKVQGMDAAPLSLSSFDAIWLFFGICTVGILIVFVVEVIVGCVMRRK